MRLLFYVEPLVFRDNPSLLGTWMGWVAEMMKANEGRAVFAVVSSAPLCRRLRDLLGRELDWSFPIGDGDVLRAFDFDRVEYVRDLFAPVKDPPINQRLHARLVEVREAFRPDVVLSFSQNRYLRPAFAPARCLFLELGPLSRLFTPLSLFVDICDHQTESLLATAAPNLAEVALPASTEDALQALWVERVERPTLAHPLAQKLQRVLMQHKGEQKLALIALQPADWLTYEGAYDDAVEPRALLMRCLAHLPVGWAACVSYHPAHRLPVEVEQRIVEEWPRTCFLPDEGVPGASELALPWVDGVVTVSSAVGLQAVLWGKPLVALAQRSNLHGLGASEVEALGTAQAWSRRSRLRLFCFLTHQYLHRFDAMTTQPGYLVDWLETLRAAGFSKRHFLDLEHWDPLRAKALLSPASPENVASPTGEVVAQKAYAALEAELGAARNRLREAQTALDALARARAEEAERDVFSIVVERLERRSQEFRGWLAHRRGVVSRRFSQPE